MVRAADQGWDQGWAPGQGWDRGWAPEAKCLADQGWAPEAKCPADRGWTAAALTAAALMAAETEWTRSQAREMMRASWTCDTPVVRSSSTPRKPRYDPRAPNPGARVTVA